MESPYLLSPRSYARDVAWDVPDPVRVVNVERSLRDHSLHERGSVAKVLWAFSGISFCFLLYSLLHEVIAHGTFGSDQSRFNYAVLLVFLQSCTNAVVSFIAIRITESKEGKGKSPPRLRVFALAAVPYCVATLLTNFALKFLAFPTQIIVKSCKPVVVMFFAMFFLRKRYGRHKLIGVTSMVSGLILFLYVRHQATVDQSSKKDAPNSLLGIIILAGSLFFDGFNGVLQERLRQHKASPIRTMFGVNLWSSLYLSVILLVTMQWFHGLIWISMHFTDFVPRLVLFLIVGSIGQLFIFFTLLHFGSLTCSVITTLRKFLSVLLSSLWFQHHFAPLQWVGAFLVFFGVFLDSFFSYLKQKKSERERITKAAE